jgi:hypothetical protein
MAGSSLEIIQGNTVRLDAVITVDGGTAADLTGCSLWFTVKEKRSDSDDDAIIQKKSPPGSGITITDAAGGTARITLTPEDTAELNPNRQYFFDVKIKTPTDDVYTPDGLYGTIRVVPWVTQETS